MTSLGTNGNGNVSLQVLGFTKPPATPLGEGDMHDLVRELLRFVGENPDRPGLLETPKRFLKAFQTFTSGYTVNPIEVMKLFEDGAEQCDEMVMQCRIPFFSTCEHHLVPFFGEAHIGYIPNGKVIGLSKFKRVLDVFARRLQVQERLTNQIADALEKGLNPKGLGVVMVARHLCMEARGVQTAGTYTTTSALRGVIKDNPEARAEFLQFVKDRAHV